MILSDREIKAALFRGAVLIREAGREERFSSTALDLTLDGELRVWQKPAPGVTLTFEPADEEFNFTAILNAHSTIHPIPNDGFLLEPRAFVLGWTAEKIQLPHRSRVAARVEGKSSLARLGLGVHVTAPTIHAGFGFKDSDPTFSGNPIQLEIFNLGPIKIRLKKGMPVCQLIFEEVHGTPEKGYGGQFRDQGPQQSM
jgi:dCTP deaminase